MPKYYCEYCDIFLTHDSPSVRKAHNAGKNHIANVRIYYSELGQDKTQNVIDSILKSHEGGYPPPFSFQGALAQQPNPAMNYPNGPPPNFYGPPPTGPPPAAFYGPPPSGPPSLQGHPSFPNATMTGPPPQGPPPIGQPPGQPPYYQPPQLMNGPPPTGPPPSGPPLDGQYPMQH